MTNKVTRECLEQFIYFSQKRDESSLIQKVLGFIYNGQNFQIDDKFIENSIQPAIDNDEIENLFSNFKTSELIKNGRLKSAIDDFEKENSDQKGFRSAFEIFLDTIAKRIRENFPKPEPKLNSVLDLVLIYEAPPFSKEWFEENPNDQNNSDEKTNTYFSSKYFTGSDAGTPWRKQILKAFGVIENNGELAHINEFLGKKLLVMDILPIPIPIDSDLRKKWSTDADWEIDGKQLPVVLFELAINNILEKGLKVHRDTKFALGMPVNTSLSIFQYYSDKPLRICDIGCDGCENKNKQEVQKVCDRENCTNAECFEFDISKTNDRMTWSIRNKKDVKYPLHKANVNNGQYPDSELIKNAFDL